jgi:hypothetical protein
MRRLTSTLFIVYAMLTLGVFVAAVISPAARALAYAPLRDLVLSGPEPIVVSVLYSTEKEAWLNEAAAGFEATRPPGERPPGQAVAQEQRVARETVYHRR